MEQAAETLAGLRSALDQAHGAVFHVDASGLQELDTAAIAVLLECRRHALSRGIGFAVQGVPAKLGALMALYGVADLFGVSP